MLIRGQVGQRINVCGTCGSGKSTLSRGLAEKLGCPYIEMDALLQRPNWTECSLEEFRDQVEVAIRGESWVLDGNYDKLRDISWQRADTVVFLDYPLAFILARLFVRTVRRVVTQEQFTAGNTQGFRRAFLSRDSILLWAMKSHRQKRTQMLELWEEAPGSNLCVVRLTGPRDVERLVATLLDPSW